MSVAAVILAAGLGTRLRPITDRTPKCLVPVGGRPLLDYWVAALAEAGAPEALLNTHHLRDQVAAYIEQVNASGPVRLIEFYEPELLGSAGTIAANPDFGSGAETMLIIYGDNLSAIDLGAFAAFHRSHDDPLTMALFRAPAPERCGIATLDDDGRIVCFVEKPKAPESDLANAGVYALDRSAYREIAAMRAFDLGFDVLPRFAGRMRGWTIDGYHRDIGTPEALAEAEAAAPALWARFGRASA